MILVFLAIVSLADGGSAAEPAFELEVLAAGRGAGYRCMAMIAKAIAANSPDASMRHLAECRELADAHRLTAFGGSARGSLAAVLAGGIADHVGRADPSFDTRDRAASVHEGIRWTFDRGQWLHCLSAVGSAADLLELKGRADLAVTIRSGRQANGFATTYSALLAADLRAAMRDTYGERTDQWWEAGERLSSREVAMLAMHGLEEIFGLTPSGVGG